MRKGSFAVWRDVQGPLRKNGTSLILVCGAARICQVGAADYFSFLSGPMLLLFLCDSLNQFVPVSTSLFWLQPYSPVLFHQPAA